MTEPLKPPFTYFGGKTSIAGRIAALLPAHEHYVEPFAGSLAVLLAKPPSKMETVSDLDGDLVNFWRVLRDRPQDLERACALTPHSRAEYLACYEPAADDLERARRVWVNLTQGRGGQLRRTGWRYYADPSGGASMPGYLGAYVARLMPAAERLTSVSLECLDALDIIRRYGSHPGALIYADPPYPESVRARHIRGTVRGPQYRHELRTDEDHRELAGALTACAAAVVLSGYDSPLYAELYEGWHRTEMNAQACNGVAGARARVEVLWSNRPLAVPATLFDLEAS
jgi:DNA adenine methylase